MKVFPDVQFLEASTTFKGVVNRGEKQELFELRGWDPDL